MFLLLLLGVALVAACVALLGRAVALPRLRAISRLGQIAAYGFSARRGGAQGRAPSRAPSTSSPRAWARSSPAACGVFRGGQQARADGGRHVQHVTRTLVGYRVSAR